MKKIYPGRAARYAKARDVCPSCRKWIYVSNRAARKAMRNVYPNEPLMNAYPCPHGSGYHLGHKHPEGGAA